MPSNYPDRLSHLSDRLDMSGEQVAERVNIDRSTLHRHERGEVLEPGMPVVVELARLYGVSVDYLVGESNADGLTTHDAGMQEIIGIYRRATFAQRRGMLAAVRELRAERDDG